MKLLTFDELWTRLRNGEETAIEAKRAEEIGKSCLETISAFSNEPGLDGGYLIAGIAATDNRLFREYEIVGVPRPEKVQADIASACRAVFNKTIRPTINVEVVKNKLVVVAHIPEAKPYEKPVYIKNKGLEKGA